MGEKLLDELLLLCAVPGPTGRERPVADAVRARLTALGIAAREDGAAAGTGGNCGNILAEVPPRGGASRWVTLAAHLDAVPPGHATEPFVEAGIVRSRSGILGADDRAGVALILEVLRGLGETPLDRTGVQALFTVGEEAGVAGADCLERADILGAEAMVLDTSGPPGTVNTASPDARRFSVRFFGRSSHAGVAPEKGQSALVMAARAVAALPAGRLDAETSFSVTVFHAGEVTNVIPETAQIRGEVRSFAPGETGRLLALLEETCKATSEALGGRCEITVEQMFHPFSMEAGHPLVEGLRAAAEECGLPFVQRRSGGGSDANALNGRGVPSVNLAVGYYKNHSAEEYQDLSELEATARLVIAFLRLRDKKGE